MIVISNSSPLIALSRINTLFILKEIFGSILIPYSVYQETVIETVNSLQKERISNAIDNFIKIEIPKTDQVFNRNLGKGEMGVLNLAIEKKPDILL